MKGTATVLHPFPVAAAGVAERGLAMWETESLHRWLLHHYQPRSSLGHPHPNRRHTCARMKFINVFGHSTANSMAYTSPSSGGGPLSARAAS